MNPASPDATPVILVRHAQSEWNLAQRFTGWADVGLTDAGREEACAAGRLLRGKGFRFDCAWHSLLRRTHETLLAILSQLDQPALEVYTDWRLNERHYGALEGLNKPETLEKYGAEQFRRWRRGYHDKPPALADEDPRHPRHNPLYAELGTCAWPPTESLADTAARAMGFWSSVVAPSARAGRRLLVVTHGNTLRGLIMRLDGLSEEAVESLEVPTGKPLVYWVDRSGAHGRHAYV